VWDNDDLSCEQRIAMSKSRPHGLGGNDEPYHVIKTFQASFNGGVWKGNRSGENGAKGWPHNERVAHFWYAVLARCALKGEITKSGLTMTVEMHARNIQRANWNTEFGTNHQVGCQSGIVSVNHFRFVFIINHLLLFSFCFSFPFVFLNRASTRSTSALQSSGRV
jgi:hypothetical protein